MKRFKVVCIGYENPSKEKIEELLKFEESWLEREKLGRKILIHPGVCIKETDVYNQSVLDDLAKNKYAEYNLSGADLDTKYNFNARFDYSIVI